MAGLENIQITHWLNSACYFQGPFSTSPSSTNFTPGYSSTVESDSSEVLHIFLTFHLPMAARYCSVKIPMLTVDNKSSGYPVVSGLLYPPNNEVVGGYIGFTPSVRPSVCPSVCPSVRPSHLPCPLCNIYSSGWILSILATNDHYHERVCRTQWPLTLTYIFKVIWPWLRKSCPLCSVYSSGWILFIFGTNDHYH